MIKNNKWKALVSSIITLLPMVYGIFMWDQLPESMVSHWGGDGVADGTASRAFMVFGLPLILLAVHWLCLLLTDLDKKSVKQNPKLVTIIYFVLPVFSIVISASAYSIALEREWNSFQLLLVALGILFAALGNYMPKTTRNFTMGVKLRWTMGNDENWNKTHRLVGRIWVAGGILVTAVSVLSAKVGLALLLVVLLISVAIPTAYSYALYRKHRAAGIAYESVATTKAGKAAYRIAWITVPLILLGVGILMLSGDVSVTFGQSDLKIIATYADDLTVRYDAIDSLEYRETFDIGSREMGFGSLRLSLGTFVNEEFGRYTLYAYTQGEGAVILQRDGKVLVIVGQTLEETKVIYNTLLEKMQ